MSKRLHPAVIAELKAYRKMGISRDDFMTLLRALWALSPDKKRLLITAAAEYRSAEDSCNSLYMGSMATASLKNALGGTLMSSLQELLTAADAVRLDKALIVCVNIIDYMREHPTKRCPTCGQIMADKG